VSSLRTVPGLAVTAGIADSLHILDIPVPEPGADEVAVRVLEVGICGTDREIIHNQFGSPPPGSADLVLGHEVLGEVAQVGGGVRELSAGDLVTATVRRGCGCPNCAAGESDYCTALQYTERGIRGEHGFWTNQFVDRATNIIPVPRSLRGVGAMIEPTSVVEKAWRVASAVQQRFPVWKPKQAVVFGAGPIGLLQAMLLRERGMDVTVIAQRPSSESPAAPIVEAFGGTYISAGETDPLRLVASMPNIDVAVECSGNSLCVAQGMQMLGVAGVLVLLSNTGGSRSVELPLDRINVDFVGGNKTMVGSVNSSSADFRAAVDDLQRFEQLWPGVTERLITHRLKGLDAGLNLMESTRGAIKAIIEVG